jgi:hypothetical protein
MQGNRELLDDDDKHKVMGSAGRVRIEEGLSWSTNAVLTRACEARVDDPTLAQRHDLGGGSD